MQVGLACRLKPQRLSNPGELVHVSQHAAPAPRPRSTISSHRIPAPRLRHRWGRIARQPGAPSPAPAPGPQASPALPGATGHRPPPLLVAQHQAHEPLQCRAASLTGDCQGVILNLHTQASQRRLQ